MRTTVVASLICYVAYVNSVTPVTPVNQCPGGTPIEHFKQTIRINNCVKHPCKLKRNSTTVLEFRFTSDRDVETLTNTVTAIILGISFPFIGVDNMEACSHIYASDAMTPVGCPLKAGVEYVYKRYIEVLPLYPRVKVTVLWALTANDGKDVMCFSVPARITG